MNHKRIDSLPFTLQKNSAEFLAGGIKTVAHQHQSFFMCHPQGCEQGLRFLINGLEAYCRGVLLDLDLVLQDFDSMTSDEIEEVLEDWRQSLLETLPD